DRELGADAAALDHFDKGEVGKGLVADCQSLAVRGALDGFLPGTAADVNLPAVERAKVLVIDQTQAHRRSRRGQFETAMAQDLPGLALAQALALEAMEETAAADAVARLSNHLQDRPGQARGPQLIPLAGDAGDGKDISG